MAKHYLLNGLTLNDLHNMEVALRLRWEACEENGELEHMKQWLGTHDKVLKCLARVNTEMLLHKKGCLCRLCEAKRIRGRYAEEEKRSPKK